MTGADGSQVTGVYRLVTTLLDHRADPATALVQLYHQRWEIESAYYALRHTLLGGRVLRSKDPASIAQEMWALLAVYQAIRHAMVTAIETQPGTNPDRAGFTVALEAARDTVTTATAILPNQTAGAVDLVGHIGTAVLASLLPPRRPRYSARIVKCGISRYHTWKPSHRCPAVDLHDHHRRRHHRHRADPAHTASTEPHPAATSHDRQTTPTPNLDIPARADQTHIGGPAARTLADRRGHPAPGPGPTPTRPRHRPRPRHHRRTTTQQLLRADVDMGPPRPPDQNRPSHLPDHASPLDSSHRALTSRPC